MSAGGARRAGPTRRAAQLGDDQTAQAAAVEHVHTYAWKRDIVPTNLVLKADVASVPQAASVEPTVAEVIALMEAAEAGPVRRSKHGRAQHRPEMSTAIWLGAVLGVRQADLCALKLVDFDWARLEAPVDESIYVDEEQGTGVHTKGHKVRFVALDPVSIQVALEQFGWTSPRAEAGGIKLDDNPYLYSDALDALEINVPGEGCSPASGSEPASPAQQSRWSIPVRSR